jgi:hypothetical protein
MSNHKNKHIMQHILEYVYEEFYEIFVLGQSFLKRSLEKITC